jgi:tRNA threonylcarbamoyladenosine biosynthesis protein TsaB
MIICLETATSVCSVALCSPAGVKLLRENHENRSHASTLTLFIEELLSEEHLIAGDLEAIAVSRGPGSYTGLRIGVSAAKGIAYAASIPLIAIDTTLSMLYGITMTERKNIPHGNKVLYCPMLDARRMEVYYAVYDSEGRVVKPVAAEIIDENSFGDIHEDYLIVFFGEGSGKCRSLIKRKNSIFVNNFSISASYMCKPAYEALNGKLFEDVAYFEPLYLKDFITTVQKKNLLEK